ncbi:MAG: hypothetical protein H0T46_28795 [Deltaproteobacteria bacterium]|nr:hypothetical protein [Deltaproteobacteria bacterium]
MRTIVLVLLLCVPALADAEDGDNFLQGVVGYSTPIAGAQYSEGIGSGGARIGLRGGWSGFRNADGSARLGIEASFDFRPVTVGEDSEQQLRMMAGPRLTFSADPLEVYFRASVGYDRLYMGDSVNPDGLALEPGFGAAYRHKGLVIGAEAAVPIAHHPQVTSGEYMDGFTGADLQVMTFAGASF